MGAKGRPLYNNFRLGSPARGLWFVYMYIPVWVRICAGGCGMIRETT